MSVCLTIRTIIVNLYCIVFVGPSLNGRKHSSLIKFDKDLVAIGGLYNSENFAEIYKLECIKGQCHWQLMNAKYKKENERTFFVASIIPSDFGNMY